MIQYVKGDILEADTKFIVCPVNVVGTMGAGLAKQMKNAIPGLDDTYQLMLRKGNLTIHMPVTVYKLDPKNRGIVLFPTKFHYNDRSELEDIRINLENIEFSTYFEKRTSMAFPKLGCGLGGLKWFQVKPLIEQFERRYEHMLDVVVYE